MGFDLTGGHEQNRHVYSELSRIHAMAQQAWTDRAASGSVGDASAETRIAGLSAADLPVGPCARNPLRRVVGGSSMLPQVTSSRLVKRLPDQKPPALPDPNLSANQAEPRRSGEDDLNVPCATSLTNGSIPGQRTTLESSGNCGKTYWYTRALAD